METIPAPGPHCPQCGSNRVNRAGRDVKRKQLFLCRDCLRRFHVEGDVAFKVFEGSESVDKFPNSIVSLASKQPLNKLPFKFGEYIGSHKLPNVAKHLNIFSSYSRELRAAEMQQQRQANTTAPDRMTVQTFKGKMVEFAFYLQKNGKAKSTIQSQCGNLRTLYNFGANLYDPESVKETVAYQDWSNGMKKNVIATYTNFAKFMGLTLPEMPEYKQQSKLPFIPNESELDQIIACAGPKLQPFLQALKETFARTGEVTTLKWQDVDLERHIITINNVEKNSNPRQIEISEKLVTMLKRLPRTNDSVFGDNATKRMRKLFHWTRTRLAFRTQNPRIKQIHLHSFRHWGATMLYHDTKNIVLVMNTLGHKSITSTQIYVKLLQTGNREEYVSKVATSLEEAQSLIESGFEYVTDMKIGQATYKLFRKRKPWKPN